MVAVSWAINIFKINKFLEIVRYCDYLTQIYNHCYDYTSIRYVFNSLLTKNKQGGLPLL